MPSKKEKPETPAPEPEAAPAPTPSPSPTPAPAGAPTAGTKGTFRFWGGDFGEAVAARTKTIAQVESQKPGPATRSDEIRHRALGQEKALRQRHPEFCKAEVLGPGKAEGSVRLKLDDGSEDGLEVGSAVVGDFEVVGTFTAGAAPGDPLPPMEPDPA